MKNVRIFDDGQFQYVVNGRVSRLYDPYEEAFPKDDIFRFAVALFDHGFNRFHYKRRRVYLDVSFEKLLSIFNKIRKVE